MAVSVHHPGLLIKRSGRPSPVLPDWNTNFRRNRSLGPGHADLPLASFPDEDARVMQLAEALSDLYELLEQYSPTWYTSLHREKARSALRLGAEGDANS